MSDPSETEPFVVQLPTHAGADAADVLARDLRAALPGRPLHLKAESLETISAAYVMTLISALETNSGMSPAVVVHGAGSAFVDAFTDLGFFKDMMRMEFAA